MIVKRWAKKLAMWVTSITVALSGVSAYMLHKLQKDNEREFANKEVIFNGKKINLQDFYENVYKKNGEWFYKDDAKHRYKIHDVLDFDRSNAVIARVWKKKAKYRKTKIDTVYYQRKDGKWLYFRKDKSAVAGEFDTLPSKPARGVSGGTEMIIRQFEPLDGKRDMRQEVHNDKYNCTSEHEKQHFLNKGIEENGSAPVHVGQIGQSYQLSFVETCLDEISANVRQLLAQRNNYLRNDKDITYIRFPFYAKALKEGKIEPVAGEKISKDECDFIINGVWDYWLDGKYYLYEQKNMERTLVFHQKKKSNYNSVLEDTIRHRRVVKHCFSIKADDSSNNVYDFSEVVFKRENEILNKISPHIRRTFREETNKKKKDAEGNHLDELQYIQMTQGKQGVDEKIESNIKLVEANRKWAVIKSFLGFDKQR